MRMKIMAAAMGLVLGLAGNALAVSSDPGEPGPIWTAEPGVEPDKGWSYWGYAVAPGAVQLGLSAVEQNAIRVYLRRVSHMVAGMNLADDKERLRHCDAMARLVGPAFTHTEGRRAGWAIRSKPDLVTACHNRAFRMDGFYAIHIRAVEFDGGKVRVTTCYYHDQYNDPKVKGSGRILPNGREAIPRISNEIIVFGRIVDHVALDSDEAMIREGCASGK